MCDCWVWHRAVYGRVAEVGDRYQGELINSYSQYTDRYIPEHALGTPILSCRSKSSTIVARPMLPFTGAPLINRDLVAILKEMDPEGSQFYPVTVRARDGDIFDYSWFFTRNVVSCVDIEVSKGVEYFDVFLSNGRPVLYKCTSFRFKSSCLGKFHVARDDYVRSLLIVSDSLKNKMEKIDPDIEFLKPEDVGKPLWFAKSRDWIRQTE